MRHYSGEAARSRRKEESKEGVEPPFASVGVGAEQTSCVAVVHEAVAHSWPETYADGLKSAAPKPKPRIVSAPPRETGALSGEKPVARRAKVGLGVGLAVVGAAAGSL